MVIDLLKISTMSRRDYQYNEGRWKLKEERRKRRAERRNNFGNNPGNNVMTGLVIIIIGGLLLLKQFGVYFPHWFFTWPMIVIAAGLVIGVRNKFQDISWFIIMVVGFFFLADDIVPDLSVKPFIWPLAIIGVGLLIITRRRCNRNWFHHIHDEFNLVTPPPPPIPPDMPGAEVPPTQGFTSQVPIDDAIDVVSVFGSVKRTVYSKTFRGGEVVCVFGGADINLIHADIPGPIIIEIVQLFGGAKMIVPPHWVIRTEITPIFGSVEDKRPPSHVTDTEKVLILRGTVLFGGVEVKSY